MKEDLKKKESYESPVIEIIEFTLEESIALSGDFGSSTVCSEELF